MTRGSRYPGFHRLSLAERREILARAAGVPLEALVAALDAGGLDAARADKVVENVVGTYALPFGVAANVVVNGIDRWVPMVVEEPSVIAAASNAARRVRAGGGFTATTLEDLMIGQIQLSGVADPAGAEARLRGQEEALLALARDACSGLTARGGGPRRLEVRDLGDGFLVVHVLVDCLDAMGANLVNGIAEALGPRVAEIAGGRLGLRILSNLCDRRRVRVTCHVPYPDLALEGAGEDHARAGEEVAAGIAEASRFAELDPYRAATHNKGILNGIDAVVLATGNDFRAVEAGAHAFAARSGRYAPLATWRLGDGGLEGTLELPLALGVVGGTLRVHPVARLSLQLLGVTSARELAEVAAAVGLASNLAALRALATEGIQRGHMSLHARSVAAAAGAAGQEVEAVAAALARDGTITLEAAARALALLRAS